MNREVKLYDDHVHKIEDKDLPTQRNKCDCHRRIKDEL